MSHKNAVMEPMIVDASGCVRKWYLRPDVSVSVGKQRSARCGELTKEIDERHQCAGQMKRLSFQLQEGSAAAGAVTADLGAATARLTCPSCSPPRRRPGAPTRRIF